jgi:putative Mg2+ transporter-C (MgtC) family protein
MLDASTLSEFSDSIPSAQQMIRVTLRLLVALAIGAMVGLQRELTHKPAGLRTHMLLALGTALIVVSADASGMSKSDLSRVVQGLVTGIGFLGGGAILKLTAEHEIHGLTTAAGLWMTAAASAAAGLGQLALAIVGMCLGLIVLAAFVRLERRLGHHASQDAANRPPPGPAGPGPSSGSGSASGSGKKDDASSRDTDFFGD